MPEFLTAEQFDKIDFVAKSYLPTITLWNRLEGRPRTQNFSRALKAEVRDALWMLSKQWQMGEFIGEDAGSAILAKVHIKTTQLTKYQPADDVTLPFDNSLPLEVKVENQAIPFKIAGQKISLDLRLLMGRHWLRLLTKNGFTQDINGDALSGVYKNLYPFERPDPTVKQDVPVTSHVEAWQQMAAVANSKNFDGFKLYTDLKQPGALPTDNVTPEGNAEDFNDIGQRFIEWFENLYYQPVDESNPSWKPEYLEYQFACSAPQKNTEKVLTADEYYHGHLDWHNLDIHNENQQLSDIEDNGETADVEDKFTLSFLPSPVTFPGMPHKRWWQLEDWKTNLGNIKPSTTDINQLMMLDFGLNYANDWFMVPFTLPIGSIATVGGLMVTNVFGENIWIEAAGRGEDEDWNRWSMFNLNVRGNMDVPADLSLVLLPAASKVLEGKPFEEVYMLRDEISNMVWAVETKIPLATGRSKLGKEAAIELHRKYESLINPVEVPGAVENDAKIKYRMVNEVLENWIPFIPVHKDGSNREIQLQRAAMPRILKGADPQQAPEKIEPRTAILREGLDIEEPQSYFIHEEEVPRAGIRIHRSFQRTRWLNGKVFTWFGFRKEVGRGEGHSRLKFDQILPK